MPALVSDGTFSDGLPRFEGFDCECNPGHRRLDAVDVVGDLGEAIIGEEANSFLRRPLQEFEGKSRNACALVSLGLCPLSCAPSDRLAAMTADGCRYLVLRAASFVFGLIASQLALVISCRFETRIPCCEHDAYHRRQSYRQGGKPEQLGSQVHGRITPFSEKKALPAHGTCSGGLFWRSSALRFPYMAKTSTAMSKD